MVPMKLEKIMQNLHSSQIGIEVWLLSPPQQTAVEQPQMGSGSMNAAGSHTLAYASNICSGRGRTADG
jgi:hypothetical protein